MGKRNKKKSLSQKISFPENLFNSSASQTTENFMNYLKHFYNYDEITLYTYEQQNNRDDSIVFEDALNFITQNKYAGNREEQYNSLKSNVNNYFDILRIVKLTQKYERNSVDHYLIIDTYFNKENEYKILIPTDFNVLNIIGLNPIPDINYELYKYEDINSFIEFKEFNNSSTNNFTQFNVNNYCFETIVEINFEINQFPPILKNESTMIQGEYGLTLANYNRKAQFILKHYPVDVKFKTDYLLDIKIIFDDQLIKYECVSSKHIINDINNIIDKFIFPLTEDSETIKYLNLEPEFTAEFMSQDFTDFLALKMMMRI